MPVNELIPALQQIEQPGLDVMEDERIEIRRSSVKAVRSRGQATEGGLRTGMMGVQHELL